MKSVRGTIGGLVVALGLWLASPALAAFPGTDGLLAVQPVSGGGIQLVNTDGQVVGRICTRQSQCAAARRPRWSPDGRAIVSSGPHITIVYTDGSCMNCQFGAAANPVFKRSGTVISFIQRHRQVTLDGIDGVREPSPPLGSAADAVWAADGQVAVVRDGWLWVGHPGKLHRLVPGSEPSWSPRGDRIVAVQRGWVVIVRLGDHHVQRLARGGAPASSPDGRWIAYVAPDHRLMIVAAGGGRSRPVGRVEGLSVDWQPRPRGTNPGCAAPPRSTVLASAPDAIVTQDGPANPPFGFTFAPPVAYMGCLPADGRERLLERFTGNTVDNASWVKSAILAGPYAALVVHSEDEHYGGRSDEVQVFDLSTGRQRNDLGGEGASCGGPACADLAQVVLGSDGVSAARTYAVAPLGSLSSALDAAACAPGTTVCLAADEYGDLLTSDDPAGGAGTWSAGKIAASPGPGLQAVACPGVSLCVAAESDIYHSSDPAGGASTWRATRLGGIGSFMYDIACPTTTLCVAIRADGRIAVSSHPAGGTAVWTVTKRIAPAIGLDAIFCSAEPRCFVTDTGGPVLTSNDPAGGPGAWTKSRATPELVAGACPTSRLCVTVGLGEIATSTAPDAQVWTRRPIPDGLVSVSCPTTSLCVAVGDGGEVYVSTDPASGPWSHTIIDYGFNLSSVSCASASLCVATDDAGHVLTATDPAGDPSAWTPALLEGDSCTDGHACTIESIKASDKTGLHTVDSSRLPGPGQVLTGLTLTGDTLSWSHAGSPRSVSLTPP